MKQTEATPATEIAIYYDGSGKASDILKFNLDRIQEREETCRKLREFIANHADVLAGADWRPDVIDLEIEINAHSYRGKQITPKDIAALWPEATWKTEKYSYSNEITDWSTVVDGVKLRIPKAIKVPKPILPRAGQVVLRGKKESEVAQ